MKSEISSENLNDQQVKPRISEPTLARFLAVPLGLAKTPTSCGLEAMNREQSDDILGSMERWDGPFVFVRSPNSATEASC